MVLTAASCLEPPRNHFVTSDVRAFSGMLNGSLSSEEERTRQVREVEEWHRQEFTRFSRKKGIDII